MFSTILNIILWPFKKVVSLVKLVLCKLFGIGCPKKVEKAPVVKAVVTEAPEADVVADGKDKAEKESKEKGKGKKGK